MKDQKKEILVLRSIQSAALPVGAAYLAKELNLAPASVGRILTDLESEGMLTKVSNKGRILTEKGTAFLQQENLKDEKNETVVKLTNFVNDSDKDTLLEVLQVRKLLEVYTAEQASLNATDDEILELERLMLEHLHEIRTGGLGSETDLKIHLAIARASKINTIYQILKLILSEDNVYAKFSYVSDHVKNTQIKQHDSIIQAIRDHDPDAARSAMETHLTQIMNDVEQYYQSPN